MIIILYIGVLLTCHECLHILFIDLPLFWTEAKARGFSLSTVSHYLSAGPARLVGLQDRKGALRPGLDADLIFVDPNASFLVTPENIRYKNKVTLSFCYYFFYFP